MRLRLVLINRQIVWGGGEYWTWRASQELLRLGHEIQVVATQRSPLARRLEAEGLPLLEAPPGIGNWFRFKKVLRKAWPSGPPDIWVANALLDLTLVNWIQGPRFRAPVLFVRGQDSPIGHRLTQRLRFRSVSRIVVNSEATGESFKRSVPWFPPERIHRVFRGIETDHFLTYRDSQQVESIRKLLSLPRTGRVVGIIGRIEQQKGHAVLLRALQLLPEVHLLVVGGGSLQTRLRRLARRLGVDCRCHWTGHVADVRPYLELSDLVVVPSFFEGFGLVAVEAQLMGKPVVASRVSSLPEVIEDGKTGLLIPVGDAPALRWAIARLLDSPALRSQMGRSGRIIAARRFDFGRRFQDFMQILGRAIADADSNPLRFSRRRSP